MTPIRPSEKLARFADYWTPRIVGSFNGHDLMVVKVKGEFVWHSHSDTDDVFMVLRGRLKIELPEESVELDQGDIFVVPKGMRHRPVAEEEAHLLLIEPAGTPNTGNPETAARKERI